MKKIITALSVLLACQSLHAVSIIKKVDISTYRGASQQDLLIRDHSLRAISYPNILKDMGSEVVRNKLDRMGFCREFFGQRESDDGFMSQFQILDKQANTQSRKVIDNLMA